MVADAKQLKGENRRSSEEGDERSELKATIAGDEGAWRRFVARNDPKLREVVRHATSGIRPLTEEQIEDVMGDFWLAAVQEDCRLLRTFKPSRGSSTFTWLTFQVARIAHEHVSRLLAEPEMVPLHEARNVPAARPRRMRSRGSGRLEISGGVVPESELAPHANHPLSRLSTDERMEALGESILALAMAQEVISNPTQENRRKEPCQKQQPSPFEWVPTSE